MHDPVRQRKQLEDEIPLLYRWLGLPWEILTVICLMLIFLICSQMAMVFDLLLGTQLLISSETVAGLLYFAVISLFLLIALVRGIARALGKNIPLTDKKTYVWTAKALFVGVMGFAMLGMLIPAFHAAWIAAHNAKNEQAAWISHPFGGGRLAIHTPAGWQEMETPNLGRGNLYLADLPNDLHLMVWAFPKIDLDLKDLKEAIQVAVNSLSESFVEAQAEKAQFSLDGPIPAADTRINVLMGKTKLIYQLRVLDCGDTWVQVNLWATPSQYARFESLFDQIRKSITTVNESPL